MANQNVEKFFSWLKDKESSIQTGKMCEGTAFAFPFDKNESCSYNQRIRTADICIKAVGTKYEGRPERISKMKVNDSVNIVREPDNQYNSNNLSVRNQKGESLANLPEELGNALSPVIDAGDAEITNAKIELLEFKRNTYSMYIALSVKFKKTDYSKAGGCTVCLLGGDQTNLWVQKLSVLHCKMSVKQAALIFELYNIYKGEYDSENNVLGYHGLDNLEEEVIAARKKMRSEMESSVDYERPTQDNDDTALNFVQKRIKANPKRYESIKEYFDKDTKDDDYFEDLFKRIFRKDAYEEEKYYWLDQVSVTDVEYDDANEYGFYHWYDVAELFDAGQLPFDLEDEDTVSIFGTDKFVAFADLSYGC